MSRLYQALLGALLLLATAANAANLGSDHVVLGGDASVTTPVTGDSVLVGGKIEVRAAVSGNLVATGGKVDILSSIGRDLFAAGGKVTLAGPVAGDARILSGKVEITPEGKIQGNASIAGNSIQVHGPVGGRLELGGDDVLIDSSISGDVDAAGKHVELGPNARIAGRLRYASPLELVRDPAAQVQGSIEHTARSNVRWTHGSWSDHKDRQDDQDDDSWEAQGWPFQGTPLAGPQWRGWLRGPFHHYGTGFLGGLAVLTALIIGALLPGLSQRLAATVSTQWGWSVCVGLLALVLTPIAAVILCITIIGIPVAAVLILALLLLMFLGYAASGVAFGELALYRLAPARYNETALRIIAGVLAMIVVVLAARAPFIGGLVSIIATLTGIGALLMQMRRNPPPVAGRPA
jgi:cytoskeletal protein CcmA (bactofilin family)